MGESRAIHMSSEVAKIAMRQKRRWVDGTDAIVDDVQEVFFASERSITGEILVKVQYEMRFMNIVRTHCGRMRYESLSSIPQESPPTAATS